MLLRARSALSSYHEGEEEIEEIWRHEDTENGDNHENAYPFRLHSHVGATFPFDKCHIERQEEQHGGSDGEDVDNKRNQREKSERVEDKRMGFLFVIAFFEGRLREEREGKDPEEIGHEVDKESHYHPHEKHEEINMVIDPLHVDADSRQSDQRVVAVDCYVARRIISLAYILPSVAR